MEVASAEDALANAFGWREARAKEARVYEVEELEVQMAETEHRGVAMDPATREVADGEVAW